jgi:hypothetical protein
MSPYICLYGAKIFTSLVLKYFHDKGYFQKENKIGSRKVHSPNACTNTAFYLPLRTHSERILVEQILSRWHQESSVSAIYECMMISVIGMVWIGDGTQGGYDVPCRCGN